MNADWKVGKAQYAEFNVPTCGKNCILSAVQRMWAFLVVPGYMIHDGCVQQMIWSMPWCSFLCHIQAPLNLTLESYVMHGGLAYWTWVWICHMPSVPKMSRVFCIGPLPVAEWAAQLSMWDGTVYWNAGYAYGRGSQPCRERQAFVETVMIWPRVIFNHLWINAIVFVPTAKAHPKAGAKELSYNSLNLAYSGKSILVSDQTDLFSFATHGDE